MAMTATMTPTLPRDAIDGPKSENGDSRYFNGEKDDGDDDGCRRASLQRTDCNAANVVTSRRMRSPPATSIAALDRDTPMAAAVFANGTPNGHSREGGWNVNDEEVIRARTVELEVAELRRLRELAVSEYVIEKHAVLLADEL